MDVYRRTQMAEHTMRDDLNDAMRLTKDAARSSLLALRSLVDLALNKLDGDDEPKPQDATASAPPSDETPAPHQD
jgi:hypothetical protein